MKDCPQGMVENYRLWLDCKSKGPQTGVAMARRRQTETWFDLAIREFVLLHPDNSQLRDFGITSYVYDSYIF